MHTHTIVVDTNLDLAIELGRRSVLSAWWLRRRGGVTGLEALEAPERIVRLELREESAS